MLKLLFNSALARNPLGRRRRKVYSHRYRTISEADTPIHSHDGGHVDTDASGPRAHLYNHKHYQQISSSDPSRRDAKQDMAYASNYTLRVQGTHKGRRLRSPLRIGTCHPTSQPPDL